MRAFYQLNYTPPLRRVADEATEVLVFYHLLCKNGIILPVRQAGLPHTHPQEVYMAQDQKLQAIRIAMETIENSTARVPS